MIRLLALIIVLLVIGGAIFYLEGSKPKRAAAPVEVVQPVATPVTTDQPVVTPVTSVSAPVSNLELAPDISTPDSFINTEKVSIRELIGKKVVLVDFWTYSCINCQRTTPYLNAWYEKYKEKGLEIIGVHTPEFEFEKDYNNVLAAVKKFSIKYPVVLDNDYSTWTSYGNRYWPRKYLIDINGQIVYDHIGEGAYEETERQIKKALKQLNFDVTQPQNVINVDFTKVSTPEIYFGSTRNSGLNKLFNLIGDWSIQAEYAENKTEEAKITLNYKAKNVYMVASASIPVDIKVFQDGQLVKTIAVKNDDLYQLIEGLDYSEHALEVIVEKPGLRVFTFTFG